MNDKSKAVMVLGGGSALGLAHIGVLSVLEEQFDICGIVGTSMGALVGGLYASGLSCSQIIEIAGRHSNAKVLSPFSLDRHIGGIFNGKIMLKLFGQWTSDGYIEQGRIPFIACAYDLLSRSTVIIDKGFYKDAMRASVSLPFIFSPYAFGRYLFVDGGTEHPLPLAFANLIEADLVIAVNVLPMVEESATRIVLHETEPVKHKRLPRAEVVLHSVFHNQSYLALREINAYAPDIVIDASFNEGRAFAFHRAQFFYDHGRAKAIETLASYTEPKFLPKMRGYYRKLMSRISPIS